MEAVSKKRPQADFERSEKSALGNNTKSISARKLDVVSIRKNRAERYEIQSLAREIFYVEGVKEKLEYPQNYHRTCKCLYTRRGDGVTIHKSVEHKRAFYSNLAICGSVWACPVCAAKIQERRRLEVAQAMDKAYQEGKKCIMVTLTFPHLAFDKLGDLLKKQAVALQKMRSTRKWREEVKPGAGYFGLIRSLELTYGDNGWHPHTHEIWIVEKECDADWLESEIIDAWENACKRAGLLSDDKVAAFREHAVDVKDNASNSDYLAKQDDSRNWGADRELVKASSKAGKKSGVHPFFFLRQFDDGRKNDDMEHAEKAAYRFLEYTREMKGKRQLFWSNGMKKWADLDDVSDEEIAQQQDDEAFILSQLTNDQWYVVLKYKARAVILDIAEESGVDGLTEWFNCHARTWRVDTETGEIIDC